MKKPWPVSGNLQSKGAKDSGKFQGCGKADLWLGTAGHNAILMENIVELLSRQLIDFPRNSPMLSTCVVCVWALRLNLQSAHIFLPDQVSHDKLKRGCFTMGLSTKKQLNENSTATSSQQENTASKEMARKHVNKETFLYRTELKTKPMEYSAQLKISLMRRDSAKQTIN